MMNDLPQHANPIKRKVMPDPSVFYNKLDMKVHGQGNIYILIFPSSHFHVKEENYEK